MGSLRLTLCPSGLRLSLLELHEIRRLSIRLANKSGMHKPKCLRAFSFQSERPSECCLPMTMRFSATVSANFLILTRELPSLARRRTVLSASRC